MLEIIAVLILIGVVASIFFTRLPTTSQAVVTEADRLALHLRHAQIRALSDTTWWEIEFLSGGSSYRLRNNPAPNMPGDALPAYLPGTFDPALGESLSQRVFRGGVTASGPASIRFDSWGRPLQSDGSPSSGEIQITLSEGPNSRHITIQPWTGFLE